MPACTGISEENAHAAELELSGRTPHLRRINVTDLFVLRGVVLLGEVLDVLPELVVERQQERRVEVDLVEPDLVLGLGHDVQPIRLDLVAHELLALLPHGVLVRVAVVGFVAERVGVVLGCRSA